MDFTWKWVRNPKAAQPVLVQYKPSTIPPGRVGCVDMKFSLVRDALFLFFSSVLPWAKIRTRKLLRVFYIHVLCGIPKRERKREREREKERERSV